MLTLLLAIKLYTPPIWPETVSRPRLNAGLCSDRKLTPKQIARELF